MYCDIKSIMAAVTESRSQVVTRRTNTVSINPSVFLLTAEFALS